MLRMRIYTASWLSTAVSGFWNLGIDPRVAEGPLHVPSVITEGAFEIESRPHGESPTGGVELVGGEEDARCAKLIECVLAQGSYSLGNQFFSAKAGPPPIADSKITKFPINIVKSASAHEGPTTL